MHPMHFQPVPPVRDCNLVDGASTDPTTEIKGGFLKVCTVTTADNRIEAGMALEIRRSCFIKPMSLLEFICAEYKEE
ncbi:hypothetical protein B9Z55_012958 [Caenorhabditis nigoni]|uniref:Uncharacterized protein n=1 Tax=Caenorhabditis nigoni TaxID=1611254 RepID=A0A2G5TZP4_9PELO|nr:hypothetical protein B9Z55_012958 [Caenorhabditis nigoni]